MENVMNVKPVGRLTKLFAVSIGHFINDFYVTLIPPILFLFANAMLLSLTEQAFIAAVITSSGSFAQPVIGYFVDKRGKPWLLIFSVIWIAFLMSISGLITNYYLLAFVTGLGALASALYHPLGSAMAVNLGTNSKGRSLAIFMTVGSFAASIAPIVAIPLVEAHGLSKLTYLMFPGFIVAGFMYIAQIHKQEFAHGTSHKGVQHNKFEFYTLKWLSILVFIATTRVIIQRSLMTFGVQLLLLKNLNINTASVILFLYLLVSSLGTLVGGYFSDIIGNKKVFVLSNVLLIASLIPLIWGSSIWVVIGFVFIGFSASSGNTSNIVITQDLIPKNLNLATGLIMGLSGGIGGLGIVLYGKFADSYGLLLATTVFFIPLILVNILTILLPNFQKVKTPTTHA
ncbi:MFS transporter [Clostridiaceae bacterium 35-E11]